MRDFENSYKPVDTSIYDSFLDDGNNNEENDNEENEEENELNRMTSLENNNNEEESDDFYNTLDTVGLETMNIIKEIPNEEDEYTDDDNTGNNGILMPENEVVTTQENQLQDNNYNNNNSDYFYDNINNNQLSHAIDIPPPLPLPETASEANNIESSQATEYLMDESYYQRLNKAYDPEEDRSYIVKNINDNLYIYILLIISFYSSFFYIIIIIISFFSSFSFLHFILKQSLLIIITYDIIVL